MENLPEANMQQTVNLTKKEKRNQQYQEFIENCAKSFGDYTLLLNYRINGEEFKPKVPSDKEERLKPLKAVFDSYRRQFKKIKEKNKRNKKSLAKKLNPFHHLKNGALAIESYYILKDWSYFNRVELKISISAATPDLETVVEEFLHAKTALEHGRLQKNLNIVLQHAELTEKIKRTNNQEEIKKFREIQQDLAFQSQIIHLFIEGHKLAKSDEVYTENITPPQPPIWKSIKSKLTNKAYNWLLFPYTYFLNRTVFCHATADTFFKEILTLTDKKTADIIVDNPPQKKKEWEHLETYFDTIKDKLPPSHYLALKVNAGIIKKKCELKQLAMDGYVGTLAVLSTAIISPPLIYAIASAINQ
ncbi:hypothetical protein HY643_00560 [Candidatus Woesearchaeota archaeon]|nr:hypothetical protein [Candidatus Woesearchaeota archaeon]